MQQKRLNLTKVIHKVKRTLQDYTNHALKNGTIRNFSCHITTEQLIMY